MASVSWTSTTNGTWSTGANWENLNTMVGGTVPLRGDDVALSQSVTVTYTVASLVLDSLTSVAGSDLDMTSGVLKAENGYNIVGNLDLTSASLLLESGAYGNTVNGNVTMTSGTLTLVGGAAFANTSGAFTQAAGTVNVLGGDLLVNDSLATLSGTIAGGGEITFATANVYLNTGIDLAIATVAIASGEVNLNTNLKDTNNFQLAAGGTLSMNNHVLSLSGRDAFYGTVTNGGTVVETGIGVMSGLTLDNGAQLTISSQINQTGNILLGGIGSGALDIGVGGTLRIVGNNSIAAGSNSFTNTVNNSGTLIKVGGSSLTGTAVQSELFNNMGTVDAAVGTIEFNGPNNAAYYSQIGGTLTGAGVVAFDGGYSIFDPANLTGLSHLAFGGSANVTFTTIETYGGNWVQTGGLLFFDNNLNLTGLDAFDGGELKGTATINFANTSSLQLGTGMDLEGNLTFVMNGPVYQSGAISLGVLSDSNDQAALSAGNTWAMEGDAQISGANGTITNNGLFEKLNGTQNSIVTSDFINTDANAATGTAAGTLMVNTGTLSLTGHGALGGVVGGAAVLDIGGAFSLGASLSLSVGELILDTGGQLTLNSNLTYAQDFATEGGTLLLNSGTLTLDGQASLQMGALSGSGLVVIGAPASGATVIGTVGGTYQLASGAALTINGAAIQVGDLQMSSQSTVPTLTINTGASYTIDPGLYIGAASGSSTGDLVVDGKLNVVGSIVGTPTVIDAAVVNSGTITASYGELQFLGAVSGHGAIDIANGAILDLDTSNKVASNITFGAGGGALSLQNPSDYTGTIIGFATGDVIELNGFAFAQSASFTVSSGGTSVTINEGANQSVTLKFSTAQTATSLFLGEGPHGTGLALIHS